jgi:hypothetical protein
MNKNVQIINSLMQGNPLMQAFIITAIESYAKAVIANPIPDSGFINSEAWTICAKDVKETLDRAYGKKTND